MCPALLLVSTVIIVVTSAARAIVLPTIVLADGNLDSLALQTLAERGALDDAGELLRAEHLEAIREDPREDGTPALVEARWVFAVGEIDEVHAETISREVSKEFNNILL